MRVPTQWLRWASAAALVLGGSLSAAGAGNQVLDAELRQPNVRQPAFQVIIKEFEDANPGVTIKVEHRAHGRAQVRPSRRLRLGSGPRHLLHVGRPRPRRRVRQVGPRAADGQVLRRVQVGRSFPPRRAQLLESNTRAAGSASPTPSRARRSTTTRRSSRRPASPASRRPMTNWSPTPTSSRRPAFRRSPSAEPSTGTSCA